MFLSQHSGGNDRSASSDFWYYPVGNHSAAGVSVSVDSALAVSAIYACALVLGQSLATVPVNLYRRLDSGGKERATDHPLYRLIHRKPNRWQTSYQFRQMMQWHLVMRYNAYAEKIVDRLGMVTELVPLHPDRVTVQRFDGGDGREDFRYVVKNQRGGSRVLLRDEVLHIRGLTADGIEGFSPLQVQRDSIGEAIAAQRFGASRLRNDTSTSTIIEWDHHFATDAAKQEFRQSWQEAQGGMNRGGTALLERGMKLKDIGIKNTDMQYIELRKLKNYDIAAIHRIPPHKIGVMERATFTNIEQQNLDFITDTMMPWFVNWEQELSAQLLSDEESDSYFFEHSVQGMLRGDSAARSAYYSKGILDGWLTRNEVRILESMNPLPNLDEPLQPLNMAGSSGASNAGDALPSQRERDLNVAAAQRVARKETQMIRRLFGLGKVDQEGLVPCYEKHLEFVCAVMRVSSESATAYCVDQMKYIIENASVISPDDFEARTVSVLLDLAADKGVQT